MEELFSGIFNLINENIPLGILILDKDFNVIFWNKWLEVNTGIKSEEILNKNIFEKIEYLKNFEEYIRQALQGIPALLSQRFHKYIIPIKIQDEIFEYMRQTSYIFPFRPEGKIDGVAILIEDVTERVKREEDYKNQVLSLIKLNEIQRSLICIEPSDCIKNLMSGIESIVSTSYISLILIEDNKFKLINKDLMESYLEVDKEYAFKKAIEDKKTYYVPNFRNTESYPLNLDAMSGLYIPLLKERKVFGVLLLESVYPKAYKREVTLNLENIVLQFSLALQNAELFSAIRESEERYRLLTEENFIGVFLIQNKKFNYVNPKFVEMTGYSKEELLDLKDIYTIVVPEERTKISNLLKKLNSGEISAIKEELRILRKDESILFTEIIINKVQDKGKTAFLGSVLDITERKQLEEELKILSITDSLTGLYNRRGFTTFAEHILRTAHRLDKKVVVLFIDLDDMKFINDTLGHHIGDLALQEVAQILRETFRESDLIARIGGDEFVFMGMCNKEDDKNIIINKLRDKVEEHNKLPDRLYKISLSIGAIVYEPKEKKKLDEILELADKLMYEEKRGKKGIREIK